MSETQKPELDPSRYVAMRLADATHTLPIPGQRRLFSQEAIGETVDTHDPYWQLCISDGSLVPVQAGPLLPDPAPVEGNAPSASERPLAGLVAAEKALDAPIV